MLPKLSKKALNRDLRTKVMPKLLDQCSKYLAIVCEAAN